MPFKPDFPHRPRRKHAHDYRAPWKYHLTLSKAPSCPDFSTLEIKDLTPEGVKTKLTPTGAAIWKCLRALTEIEPKIRLYQYIIMPDHLHLLLHVREPMNQHLGTVINALKTRITQTLGHPAFEPDYYDKIIYPERNLNDIFAYIRQNPYRLAVRRTKPEFFQRSRNFLIGETEVQAYGNLFHLRNPFKMPLVIHRADSEADYQRKLDDCLYYASNGGVTVSPFISPREKTIRREIEAAGGNVILLTPEPLAPRAKPARHDFDLCTRDQLLLIAPTSAPSSPAPTITRAQCLILNALASTLASKKF